MKIVWVKAGGLLPLNSGGRSRSYHILKWLTGKHTVSVFNFYAAEQSDPHPALKNSFARVENVSLELPDKGSLADRLLYVRSVLSMRPYAFSRYCGGSVAKRLRRFLAEPCDVIVCDFLIAAEVIPWDIPCPKVIFTHNAEGVIWRRHAQAAANPLRKAVFWREWRLTERAERKYLKRADRVLAVSQADKDIFAQSIEADKISVIPAGVDTEYFCPSLEEQRPNGLVFTGSMDWLANEDAMLYFVREVLPRIEKQIPDVSLWIVGRSPTQPVRELASRHKNVYVTGTVDDVRPYMRMAEVYVVPLRVGSGTRLKIFEAMSMRKAVVSTSIGAEGLPVAHGKNILLADSSEDFAHAVIDLLRNADVRRSLGNVARDLVEKNYGWDAVGSAFESFLKSCMQRPHTPEKASWHEAHPAC